MNKDELLEELNKAMWKKYRSIKVEITYDINKSFGVKLPVNVSRFEEFIKNELQEVVNESKEEMFVKKKI